jgi:hypothetical protein
VPRSSAMAMVGRKTETIYRRYAIADERMLREAATKLATLHEQQRGMADTDPKVVAGTFGTTALGKVRAK